MILLFIIALILLMVIGISYLVKKATYCVVLGDTDYGQILFFGKSDLIILDELVIEEGISTIIWTAQFSDQDFKTILKNLKNINVFDQNIVNRILSGHCLGSIINPNNEIIERMRIFKKVFAEEG